MPVVTVIFVLAPIIMLITLALQALSFWTQTCFSRCCSMCCFPCGFCALFQCVIGAVPTALGVVVILYGIIYNQSDDVLDTAIKRITNEQRTIEFGTVNLGSLTDDVVGEVDLGTLQLDKIEFIKNLLKAKLKTPLSKILSFHQLPIESLAELIENGLTISKDKLDLTKITNDMDSAIESALEEIPRMEQVADINAIKSELAEYKGKISCCEEEFNDLYNTYSGFIKDISPYSTQRTNLINNINGVPAQVVDKASDLFISLLRTMGSTSGKSIRIITDVLNEFDVSWAIGAFNIIRVRFIHRFMSAMMCISIASHLYLVGMVLMSMLLWYRRQGMAEFEGFQAVEGTTESSMLDLNSKSSSTLYSQLIE